MTNPYDTATERMSVLPPSLRFKGELSAEEDLLIQGTVEGTIQHTQRVTVGKEGTVKANISAQIIRIEGSVEGDLNAEHSVRVDESGNVRGNIRAPSVCLVEGSHFNGAVEMGSTRSARKSDVAARGPGETRTAATKA
jgi:cytoskeletal protein CcmA (bactofilin family)